MKPIHAILWSALTLAAVALGITALRKKTDTQDIDGGVRHYTDTDAPKKIQSEEIVSFYCKFSTLYIGYKDKDLPENVYTLQATREAGSYRLLTGENAEFIPEEGFFARLQTIVAENDLAQYNGISHTVSGLPPHCGAEIDVKYASGEYIWSSDNQDCFLSVKAMTELKKLFCQACENK